MNQPSNPSVCCQRDKLYTNPSFVVAFLNPCFSPLYLKVYTDTMSIFIVKASLINWNQIRPKNTFYFYDSAQNRTPILPDCAPIFYEWKCQFCSKKSYSDFSNRAPILTVLANFNLSNFKSLSQQQPSLPFTQPWQQLTTKFLTYTNSMNPSSFTHLLPYDEYKEEYEVDL